MCVGSFLSYPFSRLSCYSSREQSIMSSAKDGAAGKLMELVASSKLVPPQNKPKSRIPGGPVWADVALKVQANEVRTLPVPNRYQFGIVLGGDVDEDVVRVLTGTAGEAESSSESVLCSGYPARAFPVLGVHVWDCVIAFVKEGPEANMYVVAGNCPLAVHRVLVAVGCAPFSDMGGVEFSAFYSAVVHCLRGSHKDLALSLCECLGVTSDNSIMLNPLTFPKAWVSQLHFESGGSDTLYSLVKQFVSGYKTAVSRANLEAAAKRLGLYYTKAGKGSPKRKQAPAKRVRKKPAPSKLKQVAASQKKPAVKTGTVVSPAPKPVEEADRDPQKTISDDSSGGDDDDDGDTTGDDMDELEVNTQEEEAAWNSLVG
jgi:hypothetical protein